MPNYSVHKASELARDERVLVERWLGRPLADDYVIYTAAEGKADVLCTLNTRHFAAPEVQEFGASKGSPLRR